MPFALPDDDATSVYGHATLDLLAVETYVPQDAITVHLFRERDEKLSREVLAEGDPAYGLEVVGFTLDAHVFIRDAAELSRVRLSDGRRVQTWDVQGFHALRGSCAGDFVLARDDESDEPRIMLRRSDLESAAVPLELPCAHDERLLWAELGKGPVVLGFFSTRKTDVCELRAFDARRVQGT